MTAVLDEKSSSDIHFAAFDLLTLDGEEITLDVKTLDEKLSSLLNDGKAIYPVKNTLVESRSDIADLYKSIVNEGGQEGIVVRSQNGPTYKVKPLITLDAVVLGFSEGEGSRVNAKRIACSFACGKRSIYFIN